MEQVCYFLSLSFTFPLPFYFRFPFPAFYYTSADPRPEPVHVIRKDLIISTEHVWLTKDARNDFNDN